MTIRVAVIDCGIGNIGSICKMLRLVGAQAVVASAPSELRTADRLVLPGVGHFDRAMERLAAGGYIDELDGLVNCKGVPILGICLGMQLMCRSSEEGVKAGLGYIDARCHRFSFSAESRMKVPHMGWKRLEVFGSSHLFDGMESEARFYFVHSYFVDCANREDVIARATFGEPFIAAFKKRNVMGVQFHPEKSHRFGIQLFRNFVSGARE